MEAKDPESLRGISLLEKKKEIKTFDAAGLRL
jgi:hypothetical protein